MTETFGQRLKKKREEMGFDQIALAKLIGADQPTISRWENDRIFPSHPYREKLATYLKVDQSFFDDSDVVYGDPTDPPEVFWPSIINRMASLEEQVRQLKEEKQKAEGIHTNPDLQSVWSAWTGTKESWRQSVALFFLTGVQDHLDGVSEEVEKTILAVLRAHLLSRQGRAPKK